MFEAAVLFIALAVVALLGAAAQGFGEDTRESFTTTHPSFGDR